MRSEDSRRYSLSELDNVFCAAIDKLKPSASALQFMPASLALLQQSLRADFIIILSIAFRNSG